MSILVAILVSGCLIVLLGIYFLCRTPRHDTGALQESAEFELRDVVQLRALAFNNFAQLFSDSDYQELRAEPKLVALARELKQERRRLALAWLAALRADILVLWRLRRLLAAFGASQGRGMESAATIRVIGVLLVVYGLRVCVFLFGPFAFNEITMTARRYTEAYTRSCEGALSLLPKEKWSAFSAEWCARRIEAA
jgi:hypothetical protein